MEAEGPGSGLRLRARFVAGADGAHSVIRELSGIGFPGVSYDRRTNRSARATVPADWIDPASGALTVRPRTGAALPAAPHRPRRLLVRAVPRPAPLVGTTEWDQPAGGEPMTLAELRARVHRVLGADVPLGPPAGPGPHVLRRLDGGNTRVAERFRGRRIFLVGDAAHVYASRTPSTSAGNSRPRCTGPPRPACSTPTTPNAARPPAAWCSTRRRSRRSTRPAATPPPCANCSSPLPDRTELADLRAAVRRWFRP